VQSSSPPNITVKLGRATVAANGAVVFTDTGITCPRGAEGDLSVTVTEAVGNNIASGTGFADVQCTGNVQKVSVAVTPFLAGSATSIQANRDAGTTWGSVLALDAEGGYSYVGFTDDTHGFALGGDGTTGTGGTPRIRLTTDAGRTWTSYPFTAS
jgi:hypothetical protein